MPELAAHLERVAKELAREVFKAQHLAYREVDSTAWKCTCGETPKDIVEHWVGHVEGVLAAALAACAREASETLRESFIEAIREHPFDGYTLCKCRSGKFDIPTEELTREYPKINRYVFEAKQRKAYAEHVAEIAGAMRERAVGEKASLDPQGGQHDS